MSKEANKTFEVRYSESGNPLIKTVEVAGEPPAMTMYSGRALKGSREEETDDGFVSDIKLEMDCVEKIMVEHVESPRHSGVIVTVQGERNRLDDGAKVELVLEQGTAIALAIAILQKFSFSLK